MTTAEQERRVSFFKKLNDLLRVFSPFERLALYGFSILLALSAFVLLAKVNEAVSVEIPAPGGSLTEGAVGTPRFINPLLDSSQSDQDLATLIYSGLVREEADGSFIPDLASSYDISPDGATYTFHIRPGATFHDGTPVTADDVLFTISMAQNPETKSPRRGDWEGVIATAADATTVVFTLPHAYAPFLENTTLGILPKHLWESVPVEEFPFSPLNTHPVGSGPYKVRDVTFDTTGAPTEYDLLPFKDFALGMPNLTHVGYRIYANDDALLAAYTTGEIDSFLSSSPKLVPQEAQASAHIMRIPQTRVFGIFLNQNHAPSLANAAVRQALDMAIDKQAIIDQVLGGFGSALDGPVPPGLLSDASGTTSSATTTVANRAQAARDILSRGGWKFTPGATSTTEGDAPAIWKKDKQTLTLTIATADTEELVATAHAVADAWKAAGIETKVQVYPLQDFNTTILRPRAYDAVLFGEVVGRSLDLFAFWHSSQRNDPGLNLALYTNTAADKALASARAETDRDARELFLDQFMDIIKKDAPAVFLYSPELAYLVPSHLHGIEIGALTTPSERFIDIYRWYRDTEHVWDIFAPRSQR